MAIATELYTPTKAIKKTRQGMSRGTKLGTKHSKKHYTKKYRGQGGKKR